jgi:predicted GNAT family acetyltransferase
VGHSLDHLLDNPIWSSLTGSRHSDLGHRNGAAARYRADVSMLAAVAEPSPAALEDLAKLVDPEDSVLVMGLDGLDDVGPLWSRPFVLPLLQMVADTALDAPDQEFLTLGPEDVDDVMALVELTEPGPFLPGTLQLGRYIGWREEGRLVAMAGERMKPDGYTEISAVCTHPDFQGRGLGEAFVRAHTSHIQRSGLSACLHVFVENARAIALYERLGYRARRQLVVAQMLRSAH